MLTLFWDYKGQSWKITCTEERLSTAKRNMICLRTTWNKQSYQNIAVCLVLVCFCMIMRIITKHVQQINKLRICVWMAFHVLHFHPTSHQVISINVNHSRHCSLIQDGQWDKRGSAWLATGSVRRCICFLLGIHTLGKRWHNCTEHGWDYFEIW